MENLKDFLASVKTLVIFTTWKVGFLGCGNGCFSPNLVRNRFLPKRSGR
jgi:hypothetical protein